MNTKDCKSSVYIKSGCRVITFWSYLPLVVFSMMAASLQMIAVAIFGFLKMLQYLLTQILFDKISSS